MLHVGRKADPAGAPEAVHNAKGVESSSLGLRGRQAQRLSKGKSYPRNESDTKTARNLLFRPPERGRPERGSASGRVWGLTTGKSGLAAGNFKFHASETLPFVQRNLTAQDDPGLAEKKLQLGHGKLRVRRDGLPPRALQHEVVTRATSGSGEAKHAKPADELTLNPETETTDYADDTDGQVMPGRTDPSPPKDGPVLRHGFGGHLGQTVTLTHWVNGGGGEWHPQIFESVQSV